MLCNRVQLGVYMLICVSVCQGSGGEETPRLNLEVDSLVTNGTLIGSIRSDVMQPPYYIVPVRPEDPVGFGRDIYIDLETGEIYANNHLSSSRNNLYKFSALSINVGLATTVTIRLQQQQQSTKIKYTTTSTIRNRITTKITAQTTVTPFIRISNTPTKVKQTFRLETNHLSNATTTTLNPSSASTARSVTLLTDNVKILTGILTAAVIILLLVLYGVFYLIRRNHAAKQKFLSDHNSRNSLTCTNSSTNLTFRQEIENNNKSYLSKFITWLRPDSSAREYPKTGTLVSIADSPRSKRCSNAAEFFQDNLIIRPTGRGHYTYSEGYLNDLGVGVMDSLRTEAAFSGHLASHRSSNLVDMSGETPVALQRVESVDLGLMQWCHMLDWKPEFNTFAYVLDDLAKLGDSRTRFS